MRIIKNEQLITTKWSGGTTTQLFIYPEGADYQKRNFLFRISKATVEAEESTFTSLPGFKRKLMVLEGQLRIRHKDHYEKRLEKFEQDEFDGGWETSAIGKVRDFNLMMADGVQGNLEAIGLDKGQQSPLEMNKFSFIYLYKGVLNIGEHVLAEGDLACIESFQEVVLTVLERSELILVSGLIP